MTSLYPCLATSHTSHSIIPAVQSNREILWPRLVYILWPDWLHRSLRRSFTKGTPSLPPCSPYVFAPPSSSPRKTNREKNNTRHTHTHIHTAHSTDAKNCAERCAERIPVTALCSSPRERNRSASTVPHDLGRNGRNPRQRPRRAGAKRQHHG